jgi:hypothetical protein
VLATLERKLCLGLACCALQSQDNLLGGLGLLVEAVVIVSRLSLDCSIVSLILTQAWSDHRNRTAYDRNDAYPGRRGRPVT